jgi:hypothetical protein
MVDTRTIKTDTRLDESPALTEASLQKSAMFALSSCACLFRNWHHHHIVQQPLQSRSFLYDFVHACVMTTATACK